MQKLKFGIVIVLLLMAVYAVSMYFVDESKTIRIEKQINYPLEKVYPQFASLRKFSSWNNFFADNNHLMLNFFIPYEGQGSSMTYKDDKNSGNSGDLYISYEKPFSAIRYKLYQGKQTLPYIIDVTFKKVTANQTLTTWVIHTPKRSLLERYHNLLSEDLVSGEIDKSLNNLVGLMGNKVDKENKLSLVKFDSLMVENQQTQLVLGVNVTTKNQKGELFKNIIINHNKVKNYVTMDLGKKEDEFGDSVLFTEPNNFKDKEVSYFYGVPLSQKAGITDNNFSFRTIAGSKTYFIYYRGNYEGRIKSIQQLMLKAKKDTMRNGELQETFLEEPSENKNCIMKLSLPVFR